MKHKSLIINFIFLIIICAGLVVGACMMDQHGAYPVQGYMMTPVIAALITRLFFYKPSFKDANLRISFTRNYLKYWLIGLGITVLSFLIYTLLGDIQWDLFGQRKMFASA